MFTCQYLDNCCFNLRYLFFFVIRYTCIILYIIFFLVINYALQLIYFFYFLVTFYYRRIAKYRYNRYNIIDYLISYILRGLNAKNRYIAVEINGFKLKFKFIPSITTIKICISIKLSQ